MILTMILFFMATAPGVGLFIMTRKLDRKEKESFGLLGKILLMEIPFLVATLVTEGILKAILLSLTGSDQNKFLFIVLYACLVVGPAEELFKFLSAKIPTWKSREFNCKYDGIVYCTTSALVFAIVENIMYVFMSGPHFTVAISRAICCIPGHFMYGVLMGVFFSRAKIAELQGRNADKHKNLWLAVILPSIIHGIYDTLVMSISAAGTMLSEASGSEQTSLILRVVLLMLLVLGVLVFTYVYLFITVFRESKTDYFIAPKYDPNAQRVTGL